MPGSITPEKVSILGDILSRSRSAAIVVHTHPDGDALGSGTALLSYLKQCTGVRQAALIVPDTPPETLRFLSEGKGILDYSAEPSACEEALARADVLFVLDMNTFSRASGLEPLLEKCPAREKVLIDHHLNPDLGKFSLSFTQCDISSTCEVLYWVLMNMRGIGMDAANLPADTRYSLLAGMTTDTNNFANSVFPTTLQMAAGLMAAGTPREEILQHLYHEYSEMRIRAFGHMLSERMQILPGGIALMVMDSAFLAKYPLPEGESEGLVNIPLEAAKVRASILIKPDNGFMRVSIRSKKGFSANALAVEFFHGGGHENASGGRIYIPGDIVSAEAASDYVKECAARFMQNRVASNPDSK